MCEKSKPLVSVLMGIFFLGQDISMLKRSTESILAQSLASLELLICDDGSSPEAQRYFDALSVEDERVRLVRSGFFFKLPQKLNACFREARGALIARMDDDDFSHPNRLQCQLEYLQRNPEVSFVGCNVSLCRNGLAIGQRCFPERPTVRNFYFTQPYIHPTLVFRREPLLAVQGYSEDKRSILCEDYDLLLRLYAAGYKGANLQDILFDYTVAASEKKKRKFIYRWNETVTRYRRFRELHVLPSAFLYVLKPLVVGVLPEIVLQKCKALRR